MVLKRKKVEKMVEKSDEGKRNFFSRNMVDEEECAIVGKSTEGGNKGVIVYKDKKLRRSVCKDRKKIVEMDSDFEVSVKKIRKDSEDDIENVGKKIIQRQKHIKIWDLYYDEFNCNFTGKVIYWCDMEVPVVISKKLTVVQLERFKNTCFGNFLNFGEPQMISQLIHQALVREVFQRDKGEMWFLFCDRKVRFGLPEFCLISGLSWQGSDDISSFKGIENLLVRKFFGDGVVTRNSIGRVYRGAVFYDDDEAVRMSYIFLVFNFLMSAVLDNHVDPVLLNFISYGEIDSYPWGKAALEQTKVSFSQALKGHLKKGMNGGVVYNFYKENYCKYYKLNGLPYVFQVFLFETILTLKSRGFCIDNRMSEVRLFRWTELGKAPTKEKMIELVFGSGQLRIEMMIPTDAENNQLKLGYFHFINGNDGGSTVGDTKHGKNKNGGYIGVSLSDVRMIVDERVSVLEEKFVEVKKDVKKMGNDLKLELQSFHIDISKDIRKIMTEFLRGQHNVSEGHVVDDGGNEGHVVDDDMFDECGDVGMGSDAGKSEDNVGGDDDKVGKNNETPTMDIVIDSVGKEIVVYNPVEVGKVEAGSTSILDEMILTTQDIDEVVEIEKSVFKPSGRPVRSSMMAVVLRSPYTTNFGSAGSSFSNVVPTDVRRSCSAFPNVCMGVPPKCEDELFDQWFKIGLNNRKRIDKFPGNHDKIVPGFKFGSVTISSKMWFYKLKTPGQWLDHDHVNISLYYLRKLAKHSDSIRVRVTFTDCWFHIKLTSLYNQYCENKSDKSLLTDDGDIAEYIHGYLMDANTPWVDVDFVLFPVHMTCPVHWFLLIFDVHLRRLVVYNSLQPNRSSMQTSLMDVCEPYIFILPIILSKCEFWKARSDIDLSSLPYIQKGEHDLIELEFAKGLPEQIEGDCGMFTICFAEHFIHQQFDEIPIPFPVLEYRKRLCVNLYMHARDKHIGGYDSDPEYPGRLFVFED